MREDIRELLNYEMKGSERNIAYSIHNHCGENYREVHGSTSMNIGEISDTINVLRNVFLSFRSCFKEFTMRSNAIILIVAFFFFVACKY